MAMTPNPTGLYIKEITLPSGNTYEIVDEGARELIGGLSGYTDFLGVLQTTGNNVEEGSTCAAIILSGGTTATAIKGSIVIKPMGSGNPSQEYIYDGTQWQMFGDISADNLGPYATAQADSLVVHYNPLETGVITVAGAYTPNIELSTASISVPLTITSTITEGTSTADIRTYIPNGTVDMDVYSAINATVISGFSEPSVLSSITAITYNNTVAGSALIEAQGLPTAIVNTHTLILNWFQLSSATPTSVTMVQSITHTTTTTPLIGTPSYFLPMQVDIPTDVTAASTTIALTGTGVIGIDTSTTSTLPVSITT